MISWFVWLVWLILVTDGLKSLLTSLGSDELLSVKIGLFLRAVSAFCACHWVYFAMALI